MSAVRVPRSLPPFKSQKLRSRLAQVLKVAFSGGLLLLLFSRIDISRFWTVARQSSLKWLIVAVLTYVVAVLASSWRWHRLLRIQGVNMSYFASTESFIVALFFNNFLPTNVGGDVMRIRDTAGPAGSSACAATVVLADRIFGLCGLVLSAAIGASFATAARLPFSVWWIWSGLAVGLSAGLLVLTVPAILNRLSNTTLLTGTWLSNQLSALATSLLRFRLAPFGLAGVLAGSVFVQAANIAFYAAVSRALSIHVEALDMAVIVPMAALAQIVPVSINGFGVKEAAFTVLFQRIGVPPESALLVSLESTALILAFSLLGAAAYILRKQPREHGSAAQSSGGSGRLTLGPTLIHRSRVRPTDG